MAGICCRRWPHRSVTTGNRRHHGQRPEPRRGDVTEWQSMTASSSGRTATRPRQAPRERLSGEAPGRVRLKAPTLAQLVVVGHYHWGCFKLRRR